MPNIADLGCQVRISPKMHMHSLGDHRRGWNMTKPKRSCQTPSTLLQRYCPFSLICPPKVFRTQFSSLNLASKFTVPCETRTGPKSFASFVPEEAAELNSHFGSCTLPTTATQHSRLRHKNVPLGPGGPGCPIPGSPGSPFGPGIPDKPGWPGWPGSPAGKWISLAQKNPKKLEGNSIKHS